MAKSKRKPALAGGEIVLVPLYDGRFGITKVLYASQHAQFKRVILLGVSQEIADAPELPDELPQRFERRFYTWDDSIRNGQWPVVGKVELTDAEREMSTRVNTGQLWREDELLRKATDDDKANFPLMVKAGPLLAEIYVREHLGLEKLDPEDSNPIYARAYVRRGKAQMERGEYKDALEDFKAAIDLDARSHEAYLARADLYAQTGDAKRAEADRKKAAQINNGE